MVQIEVREDTLVIQLEGWDRVWALKSRLELPLKHVTGVSADADRIAREAEEGWKVKGSRIPHKIVAGTFRQHGDTVFWDVRNPAKAIVIELEDEHYARLVVEVADPQRELERLQEAISEK